MENDRIDLYSTHLRLNVISVILNNLTFKKTENKVNSEIQNELCFFIAEELQRISDNILTLVD